MIPCIGAAWYKVLVLVTFAALVPLLTVSALETRRTWCGIYTTSGTERDEYVCGPR